MRFDLDAADALDEERWTRNLLRCHRSQDDRNRRARGMGFADRILNVDRDNAVRLGLPDPFAEVLEARRIS